MGVSRILVIGSGGREHALCWRLAQSPGMEKIWCAPGNGGIREVAECVTLGGADTIIAFCRKHHADLVVIGPEQPLVDGLADALREAGIAVFGPSRVAAQLESSKGFTKDLCAKYHIPTAAYGRFEEEASAIAYLKGQRFPIVIKADGLAAGKGVIIAPDRAEAEATVREMFAGKFGEASRTIVIEEFMEGEEVSFFALCDGDNAVEFGSAQDHKAVGDGDTGLNTGGMGAYSPATMMTAALRGQVMERIILPAMRGMKAEGMPFQGVLFAGLMITRDGPKLIEFNVRFGDPETQALMVRLDDDLAAILAAAAAGNLPATPPRFRPEAALCVVLAARGYPDVYEKGSEIRNLKAAAAMPGVVVFHAGTVAEGEKITATGGRVLGATALGRDVAAAQQAAYRAVDAIDWPEGFCRRDIGWRAIKRQTG